MNHKPQSGCLAYGIVSAVLCSAITVSGFCRAVCGMQDPEPAVSVPVIAIEPEVSAAVFQIDDRSRIDAPLLNVSLDAETQWAIFDICGQDAKLFCSVMAIAAVESEFDSQTIGDGGYSIGMMQVNTRWHTERMAALGVMDLTDPVQCAAVAVDYLLELEEVLGAGPEDHVLYVSYNAGPNKARRIGSTAYSETVMGFYQEYITEMGVMVPNE